MQSSVLLSAPQARGAHRAVTLVAALIVLGVAARLVLAATTGFGIDEAYTVANARHVQLSYYDHPPLSFWLVRGMVALTGSEAPVVVRLPFILLFAGLTWLMFRFTTRLFGESAGLWAAVLLNLSPVFGLTTAGWILPDGPLMVALMATVTLLERLLFGEPTRRRAWVLGLAAGATLGLACLSKYHGFLAGAGILLFLLTSPRHRRWLADPIPYTALAVMLLVCLPLWLWNYDNDWISFRFQMGRGGGGDGLHPGRVGQNLLGQMLYVLPWLWLPLLMVYGKAIRRGPGDARWLLVCLASVPLLLFTVIPLWGSRGLPHWQAPGYLMLFPLLGATTAAALTAGSTLARRWLVLCVAVPAVVIPLLATHVATAWLQDVIPAAFAKGDPTLDMVDWTPLRAAVAAQHLPPGGFVVAPRWLEAGKIDTALGGDRPVLVLSNDPRNFAFQHDQQSMLGQDALIVGSPKGIRDGMADLGPYFDRFEPVGQVTIGRRGRAELTLGIVRATRFHRLYPLHFGPGKVAADERR